MFFRVPIPSIGPMATRQTTLFGAVLRNDQADLIFRTPATLYEKFVNAFVVRRRSELGGRNSESKDSLKKRADAEWRKLGTAERQEFVDALEPRLTASGGERTSSTLLDYGFSLSGVPVRRRAEEENSECPPAKKPSRPRTESSIPRPEVDGVRAGPSKDSERSEDKQDDGLAVRNDVREFLRVVTPDTAPACLLTSDVVKNVIFMEALGEAAHGFALFTAAKANYDALSEGRRTWGTSAITKERHSIALQRKDVGEVICEVASIRLNPSSSIGSSRTEILKKELMKDAVVKCKLLVRSMERLEARFRCRVAQMRSDISSASQQPPPDFRLNAVNSLSLTCMHICI